MTSNVIPLPKRKSKDKTEQCVFIVRKSDGWVNYNLGEVYFVDDKPMDYSKDFSFLQLDSIRAREIDDPEVIRELLRNKLQIIKRELEDALIAVEKPIVTFHEDEEK